MVISTRITIASTSIIRSITTDVVVVVETIGKQPQEVVVAGVISRTIIIINSMLLMPTVSFLQKTQMQLEVLLVKGIIRLLLLLH